MERSRVLSFLRAVPSLDLAASYAREHFGTKPAELQPPSYADSDRGEQQELTGQCPAGRQITLSIPSARAWG